MVPIIDFDHRHLLIQQIAHDLKVVLIPDGSVLDFGPQSLDAICGNAVVLLGINRRQYSKTAKHVAMNRAGTVQVRRLAVIVTGSNERILSFCATN